MKILFMDVGVFIGTICLTGRKGSPELGERELRDLQLASHGAAAVKLQDQFTT